MSYFKPWHLNRWNDGHAGLGGGKEAAIRCPYRVVQCLVVVLLILSALLLPPAAQVFAGVPTDGLVAWYPFNGNANDASGNGNNGDLHAGTVNEPTLTYDRLGRPDHAYAFDGVIDAFDYITVANSPTLSFSTGFSASFWVNFSHENLNRRINGYDWQAIFTKDYHGKFGLMLSSWEDHTLRFYHAGLSPYQSDYIWSDVQPDTWYNVVITLGNGYTRFYINGMEKGSTPVTGTLDANTLQMFIGSDGTSVAGFPYPFSGKMDSVRFYNRALTAQEVLDIYDDATAIPSVDAGAYHNCGVKTDGSIACWGSNPFGELIPPSGIFTQVSSGTYYTCGVKTDGTVACWGWNAYGQSNPPVGTFTQVSADWYNTCGVKTDGTVACWGRNASGESTPPGGTFIRVSGGLRDKDGWDYCLLGVECLRPINPARRHLHPVELGGVSHVRGEDGRYDCLLGG